MATTRRRAGDNDPLRRRQRAVAQATTSRRAGCDVLPRAIAHIGCLISAVADHGRLSFLESSSDSLNLFPREFDP
jgi:hypothetical protein